MENFSESEESGKFGKPSGYGWGRNQDSENQEARDKRLNELVRLGRSKPRTPILLQSVEDLGGIFSQTELLDSGVIYLNRH